MPEQVENGRKLDGKNSLQDCDAKEMYLHLNNQLMSLQRRLQCSVFIIFESCFQNLPFTKPAGKKKAVFMLTEGSRSNA